MYGRSREGRRENASPSNGYKPKEGYMPLFKAIGHPNKGYMPHQTGYMPHPKGYMPPPIGYRPRET